PQRLDGLPVDIGSRVAVVFLLEWGIEGDIEVIEQRERLAVVAVEMKERYAAGGQADDDPRVHERLYDVRQERVLRVRPIAEQRLVASQVDRLQAVDGKLL